MTNDDIDICKGVMTWVDNVLWLNVWTAHKSHILCWYFVLEVSRSLSEAVRRAFSTFSCKASETLSVPGGDGGGHLPFWNFLSNHWQLFCSTRIFSQINSNVLLLSFYRSAILRAGSRMATVADENCQTLPRCWSSLFLLFSSCLCFQLHFVLVLCFKNFAALLIFLVPFVFSCLCFQLHFVLVLCFKNFAALLIFPVPSVFFLPLFSTPLCSCPLF